MSKKGQSLCNLDIAQKAQKANPRGTDASRDQVETEDHHHQGHHHHHHLHWWSPGHHHHHHRWLTCGWLEKVLGSKSSHILASPIDHINLGAGWQIAAQHSHHLTTELSGQFQFPISDHETAQHSTTTSHTHTNILSGRLCCCARDYVTVVVVVVVVVVTW